MPTNERATLKIGVLTFHRCINYGSYWQARCLVDGLRAMGHDAVLLDHHSRRAAIAELKCAYHPVLPTPVPRSDYPMYRKKIEQFLDAFCSLPQSTSFELDSPSTMDNYDLVVVGSDEVWNLHHPWYGGCTLFYGDGINAARLVSYAASFGNYSAWNGLPEEWAGRLRNFESISVRDENSAALIRNNLGFEPELVLDPCLLFEPQGEGEWRGPREPYVAVYGHNFTAHFAGEVQRWAREHALPLVSIGYRNDWADEQWIEAGPHDYAQFMARATGVATNFFHGCVFALRNARPFVCESSSYRSFKIADLVATTGAERHVVTEDTPSCAYDSLLGESPDAAILRRIECLRHSSRAYLERVVD